MARRKPLSETNPPNPPANKRSTRSSKVTANVENKAEKVVKKVGKKRGAAEVDDHLAQAGTSGQATNKKAKTVKKVVEVAKTGLPIPKNGGVLLSVGTGDIGQLGLGEDITEKNVPGVVKMKEPVVDMMAGGMHSVCLTNTGKVFTFGCNDEGALGRETKDESEQYLPGQVQLAEKVVQVTAGDSHCAALTVTGVVFVWGTFRDNRGSMGLLGDAKGSGRPVQLMNERVIQIASGNNHLVCLGTDGTIFSCGNSEHGQLGRISPYNLERGGRRGLDHCLTPKIVRFKKSKKFDKVWAGRYTTFARSAEIGDIYGFGLNNFTQLGIPRVNLNSFDENENCLICVPRKILSFCDKKWQHIVSGEHHTIALDTNGKVHALGRHEYGRLGILKNYENKIDNASPTAIPLLEKESCVYVGVGELVSYAVAKNGKVYSWGGGHTNQLGHNSVEDQIEPRALTSKQISNRKCIMVSGGGQHALFVAIEGSNTAVNGKK